MWWNADVNREERRRREDIVIDQYGGVLPYVEALYICSIIYAAEAAAVAFSRYQRECENGDDHSAVASAIHETLGHAAALSRFFWPPSKSKLAQARGAYLRRAFDVEEASALHNRRLRNALEHYDEQLDEFLLGDRVGMILPDPVVADLKLADDPAGHAFKVVDPWNGVFVVLGEKFSFDPIIEEVGRILEKAYEFDAGGGRLKTR